MSRFTVQNESGQVVSYDIEHDRDPRKVILEQRIARGELAKVSDDAEARSAAAVVAVEDEHTGLRDEKGDLLKSVHGGGLDPDADGDVLGQPSGSKPAAEVGDDVAGVRAFRGRPTPESLYAAASQDDEEKADEPEPAEETGAGAETAGNGSDRPASGARAKRGSSRS